jgi:anti-anti-sigma regulatory factor
MNAGDPHDDGDALVGSIDTQRPARGIVLFGLKGAIDLATSLVLMESIVGAFAEHPSLIAVDLTDVLCIDDASLRALAEGARYIAQGRVRFVVICLAAHRLAPQLVSLDSALELHETAADALGPWLDREEGVTAGG